MDSDRTDLIRTVCGGADTSDTGRIGVDWSGSDWDGMACGGLDWIGMGVDGTGMA